MIIKRILTNNAVVIDDVNQQEKIVCGKGIAFKKRPGMEIDEASINQTFILDGGGEYSRFEQLLKDVPLEYLELSSEIINMAKLEFAKNFKDNVIITLSDHLYVANMLLLKDVKREVLFLIRYYGILRISMK